MLSEIKNDLELTTIPVVVLTTSEAEEDVVRSYALHANAYVSKPVDFDHFLTVVKQIDDFFVGVVRLLGPSRPRAQRVDPGLFGVLGSTPKRPGSRASRTPHAPMAARPASSRATGTRYGEQDT